MIELLSTQSMRTSLTYIREGSGGLDEHRQTMLMRVPSSGDWARFPLNHLTMKDLAYLTAKTGHEFAILRGKTEDILFHGENIITLREYCYSIRSWQTELPCGLIDSGETPDQAAVRKLKEETGYDK